MLASFTEDDLHVFRLLLIALLLAAQSQQARLESNQRGHTAPSRPAPAGAPNWQCCYRILFQNSESFAANNLFSEFS
jgi:hypothetical protein